MALDQFRRALGLKTSEEPEKTQIKFPPLRDNAKEAESIEAWPRGAVAFDIVFDKQNRPYILEIQGLNAGVRGILDLEGEDLMVGTLNGDSKQLDFWIDRASTEAEQSTRLKKLDDLKTLARNWRRVITEYTNPEWFDGQNGVASDKRQQSPFILRENQPETLSDGDFEHLFEDFGSVVIKPPSMAQGIGIRVFNPAQKKAAREYANSLTAKYGGFVAQRFIESRGAELAPADLKGHAQSLRLIVPFKMNDKGEVEIEIPEFGYQRVARYSGKEAEERTRMRGKRVRVKDAAVVNRSLDAAAVPMSDMEYKLAVPAAVASVKKLTEFAKTQPEHLDKIRHTLEDKARALHRELMDAYKVQIEYPPRGDYFYSHDKDYAQKVRVALEDIEEYLSFLRFLEREFSIISPELWQSKVMEHNTYCRIERVRGAQSATIRLQKWGEGYEDYGFPLKNDKDEDAAGALKFMLEDFVRKNRGLISKIRGKL